MRQLYGELDIITEIKIKGRLRWLGHVESMSEERVVKRLYQNTAEGSRSVGRPRLRWMDDVREDLRRMEDGCHKLEDTCTQKDGCHKLEDTCTQKRRLEDGREGGQGPRRTVDPWSSGSSSRWFRTRRS